MRDFIGKVHVSKALKNMTFVGYCLIIFIGSIKNASYTVQILRKLNDNGETGRGSLDASITSKKSKRKRMDVNTTNILPLWAQ